MRGVTADMLKTKFYTKEKFAEYIDCIRKRQLTEPGLLVLDEDDLTKMEQCNSGIVCSFYGNAKDFIKQIKYLNLFKIFQEYTGNVMIIFNGNENFSLPDINDIMTSLIDITPTDCEFTLASFFMNSPDVEINMIIPIQISENDGNE